jgi:hypothetical protein
MFLFLMALKYGKWEIARWISTTPFLVNKQSEGTAGKCRGESQRARARARARAKARARQGQGKGQGKAKGRVEQGRVQSHTREMKETHLRRKKGHLENYIHTVGAQFSVDPQSL